MSTMRLELWVVMSATLIACSPRPTPASTPAPVSAQAPASMREGVIAGTLLRTESGGGRHEVPDTRAIVRFRNDGERACRVKSFKIAWGDAHGVGVSTMLSGRKSCTVDDLVVAGDAAVEAVCTLESSTQLGAAPGLTPASARIEAIEADCDPTE